MPLQPTVIVGVGGQGSLIAGGIYSRLIDFAQQQPDTRAATDEVHQLVKVITIDTSPADQAVNPLPFARTFHMAPKLPDNVLASRQGILKEWWPEAIPAVGSFDAGGAGQIRAKGRLAYYLDHNGDKAVAAIVEALTSIFQNQGLQGTATSTYVYLAGSVSGGTGSGILLTLAMQLRQALNAFDTSIIGVIPLASVIDAGVAGGVKTLAYANAYSALREFDWWMSPRPLRAVDIEPFFQNQSGTTVVRGTDASDTAIRPFDLCYLYTRQNAGGAVLARFEDYAELIADSIALEMNSPLTINGQAALAAALAAAVVEPARPADGMGGFSPAAKPVAYGSTGCAALVYPVDAIADHLGCLLLTKLVSHAFVRDAAPVIDALQWTKTNDLDERAQEQVRRRLKEPWIDSTTGARKIVSAPPDLRELDDANQAAVVNIITRARHNIDSNWSMQLAELVEINRTLLFDAYRETIWDAFIRQLTGGEGDGFPGAVRFVEDLRLVVRENRDHVAGDQKKRQDKLESLEEANKARLKQLGEGFKLFGGGDKAKRAFKTQWWVPYVQTREALILDDGVLAVYGGLLTWLDELRQLLIGIRQSFREQADGLETQATSILGDRPGKLVNEITVLSNPGDVARVFGGPLRRAADPTGDTALDHSQAILREVRDLIEAQAPSRSGAVDPDEWTAHAAGRSGEINRRIAQALYDRRRPARDEFWVGVERLGLWGALTEEFKQTPEAQSAGVEYERYRQRFVQNRINQCIAMARPFWKLNPAVVAARAGDFPVTTGGIVVYSDDALKNRGNQDDQSLAREIEQQLSANGALSVSTRFGVGHSFYVAMREQGAPLFMLDHAEVAAMEAREGSHPRYIDQRYYGALPLDFKPRPVRRMTTGSREMLVLAQALQHRMLRLTERNGHEQDSAIEISSGNGAWRAYAPSVDAAIEQLRAEPARLNGIEQELRHRWNDASPAERRQSLDAARQLASEAKNTRLTGEFGSDERIRQLATWEQLIAVIEQELEHVGT